MNNGGKFTEPGGRIPLSCGKPEPGTAAAVVWCATTASAWSRSARPRIRAVQPGERGPDRGRGASASLALVKALSEMHGGTVEAESPGREGGRRSRCACRSPAPKTRKRRPWPTPLPGAPRPPLPDHRGHVDAAESLSLLLQLPGTSPTWPSTAPRDWRRRAVPPGVVLCDIGLPGSIDGYGVARAFRADPELRSDSSSP